MKRLMTFIGWFFIGVLALAAALYVLKSNSDKSSGKVVPIYQKSSGNFDASIILETKVERHLLNLDGLLTDEYYYYFPNSKYSVTVSVDYLPYLTSNIIKASVDHTIEQTVKDVEFASGRGIFLESATLLDRMNDTALFMTKFKEHLNDSFMPEEVEVTYTIEGYNNDD